MVDALNSLFQNGITLADNFSGQIVTATLPTDGTEIQVPHRLKSIPKYRIILRQNEAATIYDGETAWNDRFITLRAAASGSITIPAQEPRLLRAFLTSPPDLTPVGPDDSWIPNDFKVQIPEATYSGTSDTVVQVTMLILRG